MSAAVVRKALLEKYRASTSSSCRLYVLADGCERARALGADADLVKTQTQDDALVATVARMLGQGEV